MHDSHGSNTKRLFSARCMEAETRVMTWRQDRAGGEVKREQDVGVREKTACHYHTRFLSSDINRWDNSLRHTAHTRKHALPHTHRHTHARAARPHTGRACDNSRVNEWGRVNDYQYKRGVSSKLYNWLLLTRNECINKNKCISKM